jgi:ABC-type sugar transport system permease subunit
MLSRRQGFYVPAALPAPALLIVTGAIAYPLGLELWFSLSNAQVGQFGNFVGLANYADLLHQPTYHQALLNTLIYTVATITIKAILGMAVALAIDRHFPGRRLVYAFLSCPLSSP